MEAQWAVDALVILLGLANKGITCVLSKYLNYNNLEPGF